MNGIGAMAKVLFDTDVLVDHLSGARSLDASFAGSSYSSISRAELYSWEGADEAVIDKLLDQFDEIAVDRAVAEEAGRVRRESRIRLPDALIAATSMLSKRPLMTRNRRDFRKVQRLRLYQP
jgi:predicted nucleic acid-binding protein